MTADAPVRRDDHDGVATLTLSRPASRNALSLELLTALGEALDSVGEDPSIRVVVLAGEGPAFSAGHDLTELHTADAERAEAIFTTCSEVMMRIGALPKPVIAKVAGVATAAGCQLVATCDLAVAGASARFATPGVNIGLFCSTPAVPLVRSVAPKHAMELLLTGDLIGADDAHRIGLVNRIVDDADLDSAVDELAAHLATKPSAVVAAGKAALRQQRSLPIEDAYALTTRAMVEGLAGPEAAEGIGAFLDKRPPNWIS